MNAAALERDAFMPRPAAGLGRGLLLALLAHGLLVAALSLGVSWRASPPEGVEAELWAAVPQIAAPKAAEPEPPPPPPVKPAPPPEPVKPVVKEEPVPDAQIAIEKAKRLEDKRKKEQAEKLAAEKLAKQRKEEADKAKAEKLAEQKRKEADDKAKAEQAAKKQEAALAKAREAQMQRIAAMAGATGNANATGTALQNAGPSASYLGRIKGRIRPNVSFPDTIPGNPKVEVNVRLAPDGHIMSVRITKGSGVPEWDSAVQRAIERTEVLPRDEYGKVPPELIIEYQLRD